MKQIVCILLDNVLKHVENNGKVILSVGEETEHRGLRSMKKPVIHVQNTGEGIREESLPYIFNRFYKADTSRQYEENSFGLGLAIAKSLTERNHGRIRVISGSGMTEFTVVLPAANLENYLDTAKSVLWVTADTVEDMVEQGDSSERILEYLTKETKKQEEQFDENYTGIYGYIQGEYLDGLGWEPDEGYEPTERDWYIAAMKAKGETTIVSPYVDAQTGAVIISVSKLLENGIDVLSLDVHHEEFFTQYRELTDKMKKIIT